MGNPAVVNGTTISLSNGVSSKASAFASGSPKTNIGGYPCVTALSTLGGLPYTASLMTTKTNVDGQQVPLVGAVVTDSAGYSGVIGPAQGAGAKFNMA